MEQIQCFLWYSFVGFLLEVVFAQITANPKKDRKCLRVLPLCPMYGLGAVCVLALPAAVTASPILLFCVGGAAATGVEYLTGLYYERVCTVSFWSYDHLPYNLGGRVCLLFSALWGVLVLVFFYGVHPLAAPLLAAVPHRVTAAWAWAAAADTVCSTLLLRRAGHTDCLRWNVKFAPSPSAPR